MSNPIYQVMNGNRQPNMMQQFRQFMEQMKGQDPNQIIQQMVSSGKLSQAQLAEMVGVSRNTISSIETGQFNPTAKLALILCIALDKKFEELFYF